jgi:hypothetical protein
MQFVRDEFADFVRKKYWVVLPASLLRHAEGLKLSPLGVVPQHERRPRLICDYTFYEVNQETVPTAPPEAMQFGHTLRRILGQLASANPAFGPVYMGKYDLADAFYRLQLDLASILPLAVILPQAQGEDQLIALPLTVPMGWTESPPGFSCTTETATDLANHHLNTQVPAPSHRLESHVAITATQGAMVPSRARRTLRAKPLEAVDDYLDDLIGLAQGGPERQLHVLRVIMHSIDRIFRPLQDGDSQYRQEPISLAKLAKGDGDMCTTKEILGWVIDSCKMTIHLKPRRLARLQEILDAFPRTRKRAAIKTWQKVLGELRSMAAALPGSKGLFSALQYRFKKDAKRIRLTTMVHDFLDDFRYITHHLATRPMRIYELVPGDPSVIGATDASGLGMGGVFFVPTPQSTPDAPTYHSYLWRLAFPESVRQQLLTETNPEGTLTNNTLELTGAIGQHDVIAAQLDVRELTLHNVHDNSAALYWSRKGSVSTSGPEAYLLRLQALHQREHGYIPLHDFLPGFLNRMADDASRLLHRNDADLLTHFNTHFPQPNGWRLCHLSPEMSSALITALSAKRCEPALWRREPAPPTNIGDCGWSSVPRTIWTPTTPLSTLYRTSKFLPNDSAMDASHPVANPFELAQFLTTSEVWARRTNGWGPLTPESINTATPTTDSAASSEATRSLTLPPSGSNRILSAA